MEIREARRSEALACSVIYNHWVRHSTGTFDVELRDDAITDAWFENHQTAVHPLLVASDGPGSIIGWGTLSPWSGRTAYRQTGEISIFVHPDRLRCGAGLALGVELLNRARLHGLRVLIARLESGNEASRLLFARLGFDDVGVMHSVGHKFGRWLDVLVMQCDVGLANRRNGKQ